MRITTAVVIATAALALSACSTTRGPGEDGYRLPGAGPASNEEFEKMKGHLEQNARSSTAKATAEKAVASDVKPGVITIGHVGSLREVDPAAMSDFYKKSYLASAEKWHLGAAPAMSESEFTSSIAGYTGITTWNIPGFIARRTTAVVLKTDVPLIDFPGKFSASFWGTTGDLVAARSNPDGLFFVTSVLCKESATDYKACSEQFTRGNFDANTGVELENDLSQKVDGNRIDVTTFKAVPKI
ncbi:hypothetical protein GTP23_13130 [Pseudoduganella sp. FT93W]|uniref:Lipoprotein n=1 Tax=Duganella fentianensis TaxID=2692177 RepID=A0A845HYM8_9BURK|nr:hypothetical protein [Duganella fentianensis]MYN45992.1 hypothetical protein [Duganella fentianensis]